jgi:hypothetical protein
MNSKTIFAKEYYCDLCDYKCYKKDSINKHFLSDKHKLRSKNIKKFADEYKCTICNYVSKKESNYNKHMNTKKHISNENIIKNNIDITLCECGKKYENKQSLYYHKKKCIRRAPPSAPENKEGDATSLYIADEQNNMMNNIMEELKNMMTENKEFKTMLAEQNKVIQEIANNKPYTTNNIFNNNNNQTNNQQFNLNMFLNETCKDAMNMSDFIENLQVSMEDMEKTGEIGFVKGMSRIIMNNLNAIDVCKRPIHCSDVKRETLYVKNNGVWEKETDERKKTKEMIYRVSSLNLKNLLKWRDLPRNKGYDRSDHIKNDEFTNLVIEINKMRDEEIDKVITSVSKNVAIDKERYKMSGYLN